MLELIIPVRNTSKSLNHIFIINVIIDFGRVELTFGGQINAKMNKLFVFLVNEQAIC